MADKYANISALTEFLSKIKIWAMATFGPRMSILSYGNSTWDDFITAYNDHAVVYCRASSNSNPASGSQTRLAFMAYVNNADTPTEVEFQYYRSVSSHSASQQGDQVYVYKLNKTNGWSVTTREAMSKIATEKGLDSTYSSGTIKLKTKLKAESQSTLTAADKGSTANREYAVGLDASGNLSVNVPWTGTITGINMNGASKGTSGVVDLGTVITEHQDISGKADKADLATVATSGSYDDLSDKPTIPAAVAVKGDSETTYRTGNVNLTKANIGLGNVGNFKAVSTVASQGLTDTEKSNARTNIGAGTSSFSGSYNDLTNKPTIPAEVTESTVSGWGFTKNTGTITGITMNGASKGTSGVVNLGTVITAHQDISGKQDKITAITAQTTQAVYPIKIDSQGHITAYGSAQTIPTKVSQLSNDSGFTSNTGTVTSVTVKATSPISVDSESAITGSGTRTISHANSGATAGSYGDSAAQTPGYGATFKVPYVTVNATGHVTGISEHTVKIPASDNTTYTFANGTNGFTVTPSGGSAQTVTVTPSISNNVTGSGTSGYLTKFNGANTITNGPQLGSSTTTYLRNDGTWQTPPNTTNTAGSTDTSSKIFLVGATSQAAAPQTYSDNQVYATNGQLDANKVRVAEAVTLQYNSTTKSLDFIF